jgi:hypothetical protein
LLERTFQKAALMLAEAFFDLWLMQNKWTVEATFDTECIYACTYIARRREGGSVEWWRQHCSRVPVCWHHNCCTVPKEPTVNFFSVKLPLCSLRNFITKILQIRRCRGFCCFVTNFKFQVSMNIFRGLPSTQ